jgi:hypothetical protein
MGVARAEVRGAQVEVAGRVAPHADGVERDVAVVVAPEVEVAGRVGPHGGPARDDEVAAAGVLVEVGLDRHLRAAGLLAHLRAAAHRDDPVVHGEEALRGAVAGRADERRGECERGGEGVSADA